MRLHLNKNLFRQSIQFTADEMNIPEIYVEKDYWVSYALFEIYKDEIGKETVFKGGTALLKCYNLIERFSEDIDLVVIRRDTETDNKLKTKLKLISNIVSSKLPEINIDNITLKRGMNRKTAHSYNKEFQGNYGQIREFIILESTWLGSHSPYESKKVISFVGQTLLNNKQFEIIREYNLDYFELFSLEPTRTICEKIMSLVRFSYSDNPIEDLRNKIRHTYDLFKLLELKDLRDFFHSKKFEEMLLLVAKDDSLSFRNNNKWLSYHPKDALIFSNVVGTWEKLKNTYNNEFKNMVFGQLPKDEIIFETLKNIKDRLDNVTWNMP